MQRTESQAVSVLLSSDPLKHHLRGPGPARSPPHVLRSYLLFLHRPHCSCDFIFICGMGSCLSPRTMSSGRMAFGSPVPSQLTDPEPSRCAIDAVMPIITCVFASHGKRLHLRPLQFLVRNHLAREKESSEGGASNQHPEGQTQPSTCSVGPELRLESTALHG